MSINLIEAAYQWQAHARHAGCRFNVTQKSAECVAFCVRQEASGFAFPSKLEGTSKHQDSLASLKEAASLQRWQPLTLHAEETERGTEILALWHGAILGRIRRKHVRWLLPLLRFGVRCYVSDVTGGTEGKAWFGCNIVLAGLGEALSAHREDAMRRSLQNREIAALARQGVEELTPAA